VSRLIWHCCRLQIRAPWLIMYSASVPSAAQTYPQPACCTRSLQPRHNSATGRLEGSLLGPPIDAVTTQALRIQCDAVLSAGAQCAVRSTCRARRWRRCPATTSTTPSASRSGCSTRRCVHTACGDASPSEEDFRVVNMLSESGNSIWCVPYDLTHAIMCTAGLPNLQSGSQALGNVSCQHT
jgi:hypothetical protein